MANNVVYTCLTGNHDEILPHLYRMEGWDYICFTDVPDKINTNFWEVRLLEDSDLDLYKLSRLPKLQPHLFLNEYTYSLYIDANIDITTDRLEDRLEELIANECELSIRYHPDRDCLYKEASLCKSRKLDKEDLIDAQLKVYRQSGFPKHFGLFENNIIFRRHNEGSIVRLDNEWWTLYCKYSRRDQLSLMYLLWKLELNCTPMFLEQKHLLDTKGFGYRYHKYPNSIGRISSFKKLLKKIYYSIRD